MASNAQDARSLACVATVAAGVALVAWRRWRVRPLPSATLAVELSELSELPPTAQQPKRLVIVGVSGAGKSWLADECSARLSLARLDLDRMLQHRWAGTPAGDRSDLTILRKASKEQRAGWVADGIFKAARLELWPRADLIVVVDTPPPVRVWRVVRREWRRERAEWASWRVSRWGMAKGLLWLLWQAAGLGPQRCLLVESLVKLQADTAESAQGAERKRAEQVAKGQTTKASTLLRREVPVLV